MAINGTIVRKARALGFAGLVGASLFAGSLLVLHLARTDIDWTRHYVSEFANGRLGWIFVSSAIAHGLGNLALTLGLHRSLDPGALRESAVVLFGVAGAGTVAAALLPVDPIGSLPTLVGLVHRAIVAAAFPVELLALLLFSAAFARHPVWRRRAGVSFALSGVAALGLTVFFLADFTNRIPGAAERLVLAAFLAWELWCALVLARRPRRADAEDAPVTRRLNDREDSSS